MTAYQRIDSIETIDRAVFYQLIQDFAKEYLLEFSYDWKHKSHRNPIEVDNALLAKVYNDLNRIQLRPELRDFEPENNAYGYAPSKIAEIWKADKELKSLFNAVEAYVKLRNVNHKTVAIHIAEYRGLYNLMKWLRRKIRLTENKKKKVNRPIGDIYITNPGNIVDSSEKQKSKDLLSLNAKAFGIQAYETFPLDGYVEHPGFPLCCEYHTKLFEIGLNEYEKFPDCCTWHRELKNAPWFRKENYSYLPTKLVKSMSYTIHCIELALEKQSWYKEITDYIELTQNSYGQLPNEYGSPVGLKTYLVNLTYHIEWKLKDDVIRKAKLIKFLQGPEKNDKQPEEVELNLLINKYRQWLKIFPFQLSIFQKLKTYFENTIPIIKSVGEPNMYTGLTPATVLTKGELIQFLTSVTRTIITEINSVKLFEADMLTDLKNKQLELSVQARKLELHELDLSDWNDKSQYIKLLKKWFKGEQKFIKEISPILAQSQSQANFTQAVLEGIRLLQNHDVNEQCIRSVKENKGDREAGFQYWFKTFLTGRLPEFNITSEEAKGYGKIDLKVSHKTLGTFIVEFKGWWNNDRFKSPEQLCSYLTDFEKGGYVFMINHLKTKSIEEEYKCLVNNPQMHFIDGSWKELKFEGTEYTYFESKHKFGIKEKFIRHFIFNAYS